MGVCIEGSSVENEDVKIDESFEKCPIAWAIDIPLMVKRLPKSNYNEYSMNVIVRLMGDPDTGFAPLNWMFEGSSAPPVLAERSDGIPFMDTDWAVLDHFVYNWPPWDEPSECRRPTRKDFVESVKSQMSVALINRVPAHAFLDVWEHLDNRYPVGISVKAVDLTSEMGRRLNGTVGEVNGRYENGRVGVVFPEPFGVKALIPKNLCASAVSWPTMPELI